MDSKDVNEKRGFETNDNSNSESVNETGAEQAPKEETPVPAIQYANELDDSEQTTKDSIEIIPHEKPKPTNQIKTNVPGAKAILTLGILSIVSIGCCLTFNAGPILAIIALSLIPSVLRRYYKNPELYTPSSLSNVRAGKICAIIGLSIGAAMLMFWIFGTGLDALDGFDQIEEVYHEVWDEVNY